LRSEDSCQTAKRLYGFREQPKEQKHPYWSTLAITFAVMLPCSWYMATHWLSGYEGISLFWRSALTCLFITNIAMTLSMALSDSAVIPELFGVQLGVVKVEVVETVGLVAVAIGLVVVATEVGFVVLVAVLAAVLAVIAVLTMLVAAVLAVVGLVRPPKKWSLLSDSLETAIGIAASPAVIPGRTIGIVINALSIRLVSALLNLPAGLRQWRANWFRTVLSEDIRLVPALIPGIGELGVKARLNFDDNAGPVSSVMMIGS